MSPRSLTCTVVVLDERTTRVVLTGDLVHATADELLRLVDDLLARGGLGELRLGCAGIGFCDSYGLSTLLAVHRQATGAGVGLRLEDRPASLDRLLRRTNTLDHLTGGAGERAGSRPSREKDGRSAAAQ
ncbi:STAS domain-containing protein [Actinosynnema sp. NPDC059335]|uniref:STAS domain-containing protein n=1 Tax=Actinosynnema sp. NPDC059335 TaxID=3346804 RepID=UPI00366D0773